MKHASFLENSKKSSRIESVHRSKRSTTILLKTGCMLWITILLLSCSSINNHSTKEPIDYVNSYMGNISHLLVPTFPTIHLPHSMLRVYPERNDYTGDVLQGLPIIVTSHKSSSAFNLSPFYADKGQFKPVINYSYDNERITPYSYYVYLDEEDIAIDYVLSHQSAMY